MLAILEKGGHGVYRAPMLWTYVWTHELWHTRTLRHTEVTHGGVQKIYPRYLNKAGTQSTADNKGRSSMRSEAASIKEIANVSCKLSGTSCIMWEKANTKKSDRKVYNTQVFEYLKPIVNKRTICPNTIKTD